jgi:Holliday junction resolvasome RuvABC ATP-dependent DNA helicase subunit
MEKKKKKGYMNPFTPVFGNEPSVFAGREGLLAAAVGGLINAPGDPNRITIFTGPRGSGKTVLISKLASEAESRGWIAVHTFAHEGMLKDLAEQIERHAAEFLPTKAKSALTGIIAAGVGFTREMTPQPELTWRSKIEDVLDVLKEKNIGLLFTIDEINADVEEMIYFVLAFQVFVTENRNVAMFLAGLPDNVMQMYNHKSISFLRRAFLRRLEPLGMPDARLILRRTVELTGRRIAKDALETAASNAGGFPFLIQLIGYHSFNQSDKKIISLEDVEAGMESAWLDAENMFINATMFTLSQTDLKFLLAMAADEKDSAINDIIKRLGVSASFAGNYRRRLTSRGIIYQSQRGRIAFSLPLFKMWLKERYHNG